jgi:hypothetical protein
MNVKRYAGEIQRGWPVVSLTFQFERQYLVHFRTSESEASGR